MSPDASIPDRSDRPLTAWKNSTLHRITPSLRESRSIYACEHATKVAAFAEIIALGIERQLP